MKQTKLDTFLSAQPSQDSDSDSEYVPSPSKSGRKLPEVWTRVKPRHMPTSERVTVFDIEKDLNRDRVLQQVR